MIKWPWKWPSTSTYLHPYVWELSRPHRPSQTQRRRSLSTGGGVCGSWACRSSWSFRRWRRSPGCVPAKTELESIQKTLTGQSGAMSPAENFEDVPKKNCLDLDDVPGQSAQIHFGGFWRGASAPSLPLVFLCWFRPTVTCTFISSGDTFKKMFWNLFWLIFTNHSHTASK